MADELSRIDNPTQTVIPGETTVSESYGAQNTRAEGASNGFDGTLAEVSGTDIELVASGGVDVNGVLYAVTNTATLTPSGDGVWYIKLTGSGENLTPILQASIGTFDGTKNGFYDSGLRVLNWEIVVVSGVPEVGRFVPQSQYAVLNQDNAFTEGISLLNTKLLEFGNAAGDKVASISALSSNTLQIKTVGNGFRIESETGDALIILTEAGAMTLLGNLAMGNNKLITFESLGFLDGQLRANNADQITLRSAGNSIRLLNNSSTEIAQFNEDLSVDFAGQLKASNGTEISQSIGTANGTIYEIPDNTTFATLKGYVTMGVNVAGSLRLYFETLIDGAWEEIDFVSVGAAGTITKIMNTSIIFQGNSRYRFRVENTLAAGGAPAVSIRYVRY